MNKKTLMIVGLALLGCNGQMQAMSAFKKGIQNARNTARVCGQCVKKNPVKTSMAVAAPVCAYQANKQLQDHEQQLKSNLYLDPQTQKTILELGKKYGLTPITFQEREDGESWGTSKLSDGTIILHCTKENALEANSHFRKESDSPLKKYSYKIEYTLKNLIFPEYYPTSDKGDTKFIILHEFGHTILDHSKKTSAYTNSFFENIPNPTPDDWLFFIFNKLAFSRKCEREADEFAINELMKNKDLASLKAVSTHYHARSIIPGERIHETYDALRSIVGLDIDFFQNKYSEETYCTHPLDSKRATLFQQKADELEKQLAEESKK